MDTIYSNFIRHITDSGLMVVENIIERMASSVGGHLMNLANLDHRFYVKNRLPNNFRLHMVYVAPSGYTKSTYFQFMLRSVYGLLYNKDVIFPVDVHSSFSVASWLGTMKENKETGEWTATNGIMEKYKRGLIGADDYQTLKLMFDGEGIGEDERALMTALDTDEAVKNLSTGQIRIKNVGVTCWFGMRPTRINLRSGLARRFMFSTYFPSKRESDMLRSMSRGEIKPSFELEDDNATPPMLDVMTKAYNLVVETGPVELDLYDLNQYLDRWDIPHFEEKLYRTMAIGWSVANGTYPVITLGPDGKRMIEDELACREMLRTDPFRMMFYRILSTEKGQKMGKEKLLHFMTSNLQFEEDEARYLLGKEKQKKRLVFPDDDTVKLNWKPEYLQSLRKEKEG
jgi:hypothetical protein